MAAKRPVIDTEPDEVFDVVFGPAADQPFGPAGPEEFAFGESAPELPDTAAPQLLDLDVDERNMLDLDALELPDEIDENLWAEADPEHGGVADPALFPDDDDPGPGEPADADDLDLDPDVLDSDSLDLDALELPDEIDENLWAETEPEPDGAGEMDPDPGPVHGEVFDAVAAEALRSRWMAHLDGGVVGFRLDLTDKAAIDADGLAFLAAFARELKGAGGALTVAASGQVLEVLGLCALDRRWPVALEGER